MIVNDIKKLINVNIEIIIILYKVRLKGFNDSKNKNAKKINDIKYLDDYITNYCSLGAKVFLIKKLK